MGLIPSFLLAAWDSDVAKDPFVSPPSADVTLCHRHTCGTKLCRDLCRSICVLARDAKAWNCPLTRKLLLEFVEVSR